MRWTKREEIEWLTQQLRAHEEDIRKRIISNTDEYKTYNSWRAIGKQVRKGCKAHRLNDVPMFHISQVKG